MMNAAKLNDWLQVIGMFGLIASLIFVGLQIKQDHEIALSSIYQARSNATVESSIAAINSPAFLSAAAKLYADRSADLTMQEAIAWSFYIGSAMTMYENNHQQYLLGFLGEDHWQRNVREMTCMLELPLSRELIAEWEFRGSFKKLMSEVAERVTSNPTGCWDTPWSFPLAE